MFKTGERVRASHILISANMLEIIQNTREKNKKISPEDLNKKVEKQIADQKVKAEDILAKVKANPDKFEFMFKKSNKWKRMLCKYRSIRKSIIFKNKRAFKQIGKRWTLFRAYFDR